MKYLSLLFLVYWTNNNFAQKSIEPIALLGNDEILIDNSITSIVSKNLVNTYSELLVTKQKF